MKVLEIYLKKKKQKLPAQPVATQKKFTKTTVTTKSTTQNFTQYAEIDSLLAELETPDKNPQTNTQTTVISFLAYCDGLTKLVRQGASDTLGLLKTETEGNAHHSLTIICDELVQKNNEFPAKLKAAPQSEKSDPIFLRLHKIVTQAVNSTKKLAEKDPILTHIIDISHPCNSYLNEIELLQYSLKII